MPARTLRWPLFAALLVGLCLSAPAVADNWPQWRGPKADGISQETDLPARFGPEENVLWRVPLPGAAGSTPVIWDDKIFLTSAKGGDLLVMSFDTSGKERWQQVMAKGNKAVMGDEGNMASPSPMTDGKHVWFMMGTGEIGCYTLDGGEVWKFGLQQRYGKFTINFGMAATPFLDGDRLYVQLLHTNGALVICLDKATGEEVWKINRASDARAECLHSYASPFIFRDGPLELLITHGADYVVALKPSDGEEVWRCGGLNPKGKYNPTLRFVASPIAIPGLVVVPSAKDGPVLGLKPDSKGDLTNNDDAHVWTRAKNSPDVPSPLLVDGLLYLCRENGALICMDAVSGKEYYTKRVHNDRHRASPVYADGKIFLTARDGVINVIKPGKEFEVLATNPMKEAISASPAMSGGRIYLRSFDALYAIGKK